LVDEIKICLPWIPEKDSHLLFTFTHVLVKVGKVVKKISDVYNIESSRVFVE
jgi:hypothetical protein